MAQKNEILLKLAEVNFGCILKKSCSINLFCSFFLWFATRDYYVALQLQCRLRYDGKKSIIFRGEGVCSSFLYSQFAAHIIFYREFVAGCRLTNHHSPTEPSAATRWIKVGGEAAVANLYTLKKVYKVEQKKIA